MKKRTRLKSRAQRRCESNRITNRARANYKNISGNKKEWNYKFVSDGVLILDRDEREIELIPKTDARYPN